jgi:hypothetical protein
LPILRVYFDCTEFTYGSYVAHFSYSSIKNITIEWGPDNLLSNFKKPIENFEVGFHLDAMEVSFDDYVCWNVTSNGVLSSARADTLPGHLCLSVPQNTYYQDSDGDTYGNPSVSTEACTAPLGYVSDNTDCDDNDAAINPDTVWYHDGDGDTYGDPGDSLTQCTQPADYVLDNTDCDDTDANVHPEATEVCNGIDDDCNGEIDDCSGDPIVRVYFDCTEYISGEYIAHFSYSSTQNITILWGPDNLLSNFEKPIENFEVGFHLDAMQVPFDGKLYWWVTSNGVTAEARADDQHICISPP